MVALIHNQGDLPGSRELMLCPRMTVAAHEEASPVERRCEALTKRGGARFRPWRRTFPDRPHECGGSPILYGRFKPTSSGTRP